MENNKMPLELSDAEKDVSNMETHMDTTDAGNSCVVPKESDGTILTTTVKCGSLTLNDVVNSIQHVAAAVYTALKKLEEMNTDIKELRTASNCIKDSVKMLEVVVCTQQDCNKAKESPNVNKTLNSSTPRSDGHDSGQKRKTVDESVDEEFPNVILQVSDSDEDPEAKKLCHSMPEMKLNSPMITVKPTIPSAWTQTSFGNKKTTSELKHDISEYKRSCATKVEVGQTSGAAVAAIVKKLFETPSPNHTSPQGRANSQVPPMPNAERRNRSNELRHGNGRGSGSVLPKGIKLKFRPTNDMLLEPSEAQACAYLFHIEQSPGEMLVRARYLYATRADLECLLPNRLVNSEIVTLACEKTRWVQTNLSVEAVWTLPPSFEDDIFMGRTLYELKADYAKEWMEPFAKLKFIYVPLRTTLGHWYLMVISMQEMVIYHLDSHLNVEDIDNRRDRIGTVAGVISQMVSCPDYSITFQGRRWDFGTWPIQEARGIPNCGRSDNSALWVLEWLEMEQFFQPNLVGTLHENSVRMRTAANLMLGLHNELKTTVEQRTTSLMESFNL